MSKSISMLMQMRTTCALVLLACVAALLTVTMAAPNNKKSPPQNGGGNTNGNGNPKFKSPVPSSTPSATPESITDEAAPGVCSNRFECQSLRRSDCKRCLYGRRRSLCFFATEQLFLAAALPPGRQKARKAGLRRKLSQFAGDPDVDDVYCRGFMASFVDDNEDTSLDVGNTADFHAEGAGEFLELYLAELGAPAQVNSSVEYSIESPNHPPQPSPLPQPIARRLANLVNHLSHPQLRPSFAYHQSEGDKDFDDFASRVVFLDEAELDEAEIIRRLAGSVRIPVSAKQVITPNGTIRRWVVIQALRKLTNAPGWADAFRKDSSQFKVVRRWDGVYVVFIGFNQNFSKEFY